MNVIKFISKNEIIQEQMEQGNPIANDMNLRHKSELQFFRTTVATTYDLRMFHAQYT